jgi:putative CocE/NonD family hydrolase
LFGAKLRSGLKCALNSLTIGLLLNGAAGFSQASSTATIQLSATALDPLVGQYRYTDEPEVVTSFSRDGNHFYVENPRARRTELVATSPLEFSVDKSPVKFVFVREPNGKVTSVRRIVESETTVATKISDSPAPNGFRPYDRDEVMIPMRDGVKLHAVILRPQGQSQPLPFLLERTPYGVGDTTSDTFNSRSTELAHSGYIFVAEDIRGRFKSEGSFVMMRPILNHADPKEVDESTDAYDTVDWLIKNIAQNNGRVGVFGVSYPGFLTAEAGIDPHPAVKAISPQAPMTDVWIGDDFFHNGAFRQTYGYDYALGLESSKENTFGKLNEDAYTYFLGGSFASAVKKSGTEEFPTWKGFVAHPAYDSYWSSRAVQPHLTHVAVPTLEVGGWWDQEDLWGPQAEYAALQPHNTKGDVFMVLGPWNHGGWARTTRHLGSLDFGAPVGDQFRQQIEAPFFAHFLKDEQAFDLKNTATFQTGSNQWKRYAEWPPKEGVQTRSLFLQADGTLNFDRPKSEGTSAAKEYVSDPADPVPYRKRPIQATYAPGSKWYTWLVEDQRPFNERKDVASWSTPALDHDVTVTGDVMADLFASTSGTDGDWIVKLIDAYPDEASQGKMAGFELMIVDEIFRGRYRKSYQHPEAAPANKVEEYKFSLHAADHVFLKGHKIMVQVQSSWFPLYDRNPQTYVQNIMTAAPVDYKAATEKIYGTREYPSHIELPVAK